MATQTTTLLILIVLPLAVLVPSIAAAVKIPAVFIFGDSTADVGNNNFLPTTKAKANFWPYGLDLLPPRATGRFSNGLNSADFLAQMMGFTKSPPPFLSLTGDSLVKEALRGINFASAGSGILDTTGNIYGGFISMGKQLQYFETVCSNLTAKMGTVATVKLLSNSIFLISTGSNDLFEAYGAHGPLNRTQKTNFIANLALTYKGHLRAMYNLGARKVGLISIPPIGCCPALRSLNSFGGCLEDLNESSQEFFITAESMLRDLSTELKGLKYALGNSYQMVISFFDNPIPFGFKELKAACCGAGKFNGESPCLPNSTFCSNRDEYLFWDMYHPTQAGSKLAAQTLFGGSTEFVRPVNFGQLAGQLV